MATTQDERTRKQLHSNEITTSLVTLRQELEESRAIATAARVSEEAGRQQLARMMDEQLAQIQTIEALRRQVETSNNAARDAKALLRANQDQQQQYLRMPPPSNFSTTAGGSSATLLLFHLLQLHRQGCAQERCMAWDIIMWVHRLTRAILNR